MCFVVHPDVHKPGDERYPGLPLLISLRIKPATESNTLGTTQAGRMHMHAIARVHPAFAPL